MSVLLLLLFVDGDDCVLLSLYLVKRPAQHFPVIQMLHSKNMSLTLIIITLQCIVYPLALYFYKVKLVLQGNTLFLLYIEKLMLTGIYIIYLIFALTEVVGTRQNRHIETFLTYMHNPCSSKNYHNNFTAFEK